MEGSGHSSMSSSTSSSARGLGHINLDLDSEGGSSHSTAQSVSSFGDFGDAPDYGAKYTSPTDLNLSTGVGGRVGSVILPDDAKNATDDDTEFLRKQNLLLKKELRQAQDAYDAQGLQLAVTTRRQILTFASLPGQRYSPLWHFTCRGLEYTSVYWWLARDQAWVVHDVPIAINFGILSLLWSGLSLVRSIESHFHSLSTTAEIANALSRCIWLVGMYIWMDAAVIDSTATANDIYTPACAPQRLIGAGIIFTALIMQFCLLYTRIKGWKIVNLPDEAVPMIQARQMKPFENPRLRAKFYLFFGTFRDWEYACQFLWIGKDLAAILGWQTIWVVWCIALYFTMVFFLTVTFNTKKGLVDFGHFLGLTGWMLGTLTFQMTHMLFHGMHNMWQYQYPRHMSAQATGAYFANAILLLAYIPIGVYYFFWVGGTVTCQIPGDDQEMVPWDLQNADMEHFNYEMTHARLEPDRIEEDWLAVNRKFEPV